MRLVSVAVPVPAVDALTYRVPDPMPVPVPGARVLVPLGTRVLTGVVLDGHATPPDAEPKDIVDVLDDRPLLPPDVLTLVRWVADYYACGAGEALSAAMPPRTWIESERHAQITAAGRERLFLEKGLRAEILAKLADGKPARVDTLTTRSGIYGALTALERDGLVDVTRPLKGAASAFRTVRVATLTLSEAQPRGARQIEAVERLRAAPDGIDTAVLAADGISAATIGRLSELGLVAIHRRRIERDPFEQQAALPAVPRRHVTLTPEQANAYETLRAWADAAAFQPVLLHGVTGSGKTELYLRLADAVRGHGRGVLLLVPEIALTPAVAALFRGAFGERVAIQHSGLSDGERHDQWHADPPRRRGRGGRRALGGIRARRPTSVSSSSTRSTRLLTNRRRRRATTRATWRWCARARPARWCVLGSATPSLETFHNATTGRYRIVSLARRVLDRPMAAVRVVDMREEFAANGPDVILSAALVEALRDRVARQEQAIVLLNRRGYATVVFCRQCSDTLECRTAACR